MKVIKKQLIELKECEYDFTGYALDSLLAKMVKHIGSTDSTLRDELIYTTFGQLIVMQDLLDSEQLNQLMDICLNDQHLFIELGETESDSVFARSFSVLVAALIIHVDKRKKFLSADRLTYCKERLFTYIANEKDGRGYVMDKGWAHAVAHAADALNELAGHPSMQERELQELLAVVQEKVLFSDSVYSHNEEERMALSVVTLIERKVMSERQIIEWIGSFSIQLEERTECLSDPDRLYIMLNVRNFLYSLYFRLRYKDIGAVFQHEIEKTLGAIREF